MIFDSICSMYSQHEFLEMASSNKLFCTFIPDADVEDFINNISISNSILYNKIFVLKIFNESDLVCTYNIDPENSSGKLPPNTISVHRKKESNSLYTINALNELIKKLNNGMNDSSYQVNWNNYRNTILLTRQNELQILKTKIYKIVELN